MPGKFSVDLEIGHQLEDFIAWVLGKKYASVVVSQGRFKYYDILVSDTGKKIECKFDKKSKITKNIAVEYESFGKPSGVDATLADVWVVLLWDDSQNKWVFAIIPVVHLKTLCIGCKKVSGGDYYASRMYLLPKEKLLTSEHVIVKTFDNYLLEYKKLEVN